MPEQEEPSFIKMEAHVVDQLSSNSVRVELQNGNRMIAALSGELRMSLTRLGPGQAVMVEFAAYDLSKGRIVELSGNDN
ncbi:MAG: translation initiation factor IF-1 [Verrucomicrobiota bacterium]